MINNALFKETIDARIFASLLRIGSRWVSPTFFPFYPATLRHKRGLCGEENTSYFIRKETYGMTYKDGLILAIE